MQTVASQQSHDEFEKVWPVPFGVVWGGYAYIPSDPYKDPHIASCYNTLWQSYQLGLANCDASVREAVIEECAKAAETCRPVSQESAPEHWKAYEKSWEKAEKTATQCAYKIRELLGVKP